MAMNLTIPANYTESIYDDVWINALSSASGQTDLKYVVEIYRTQPSLVKIYEGKVYPEPDNKYMYFNSAAILRNVFSEIYLPIIRPNAGYSQELNTNIEMQIRIGTDYSGVTTLNEASGNVVALTSRPKFFNRRWNKKSVANDIKTKFQTDRTTVPSLINNSDNFFIGFLSGEFNYSDVSGSPYIGFQSYNANGGLINNAETVWGLEANLLNIGPNSLFQYFGSKPNLDVCDYYIFYVRWTNTSSVAKRLNYRINKGCNQKYNTIPIHFCNRYNSFETMRFDLVSRITVDVERKSYTKRDILFQNTDIVYTAGNVYNENKINYNATYNYTMKLTSDLLDDQDWEWLEDLIESQKIYMDDDGYFYPVTIKTTNYEISKYINNRLRPLEIEIEFNSPRLSSAR